MGDRAPGSAGGGFGGPVGRGADLTAACGGTTDLVDGPRASNSASWRGVLDSIEGNVAVPVSAREAAVTLAIIEAARLSASEGRRVELQ